jgi:membrane protein required for colicin V production
MDWSLLVFLVVILFFAYRGFRKGLLKSIARILSVVAGYACAILYSKQVSGIIESELQLQGILALIAASLLLFFGASILVGLLFWLLEKLLAGDGSVSTASSIGGAVVGLRHRGGLGGCLHP